MSLDSFSDPDSIAVIGASNNPKKLVYEVFKNLQRFEGDIYPVNVNEDQVLDRKAYNNVKGIEEEILGKKAGNTPSFLFIFVESLGL